MLKAYWYDEAEVEKPDVYQKELARLKALGTNTNSVFRRLGIEAKSVSPEEADVFIAPNWLGVDPTDTKWIYSMKYFKDFEERHVFLVANDDHTPIGIKSVIFRCSYSEKNLKIDTGTVPWPGPVDDLVDYINIPSGGFKYDVCLRARVSDLRERVVKSCIDAGLKCYAELVNYFFGYIANTEEGQILRKVFCTSISESRLSLAPYLGALNSYRFFETMSMARVPVLVAPEYPLPREDLIDYSKCSLRFLENENNIGGRLKEWLSVHSDEEIIQMGKYGRECWDKYLNREKWATYFAEILEDKFCKGK